MLTVVFPERMIKDTLNKNSQAAPNSEEMAVLHRYFPSCFTNEGKFDIEIFERQIKDSVDITKEGYSLNFLGKDYARLIASLDTTTVISPDEEHNSKPENKDSENVYISGDNLDALHHLLKSYAGKIKCIYIDPPYNTGSDGFIYNDKFSFSKEELVMKLSISEEQAAKILDLTKRGSASHSAWLMFMAPRLQLAKDLLTDDGVIFISIDDNEQANLKLLCDDIFGEENFVAMFPWRKRTAKSDVPFGVSQDFEWIVAYAKTEKFIAGVDRKERKYYETSDFPGKPWRVHDMTTQKSALERPNSNFTMVNPKNGNEYPANPKRTWCVTTETFDEYYQKGKIVFPGDYDFLHSDKPLFRYWKEDDMKKAGDRFGLFAVSTMLPNDVGMSQDGTKDFDALFDAKIFGFPKPVNLIKHFIEASVEKDKEEPTIVLDFFSGSGTTAQAVMELNSLDDGYNIEYILVQLPEYCKSDSEAYANGYKTIDEIGRKRIELATAKIKKDTDAVIDYGFKHYTLKEVPQNTIDQMEIFDPKGLVSDENIKTKFGVPTILTTWLVRDGYGFNAPVEEIPLSNYTVWRCKQHLYMIDEGLTESDIVALVDLFNLNPTVVPSTIVVFGYSFAYHNLELVKKNLRSLKIGEDTRKLNIEVRY